MGSKGVGQSKPKKSNPRFPLISVTLTISTSRKLGGSPIFGVSGGRTPATHPKDRAYSRCFVNYWTIHAQAKIRMGGHLQKTTLPLFTEMEKSCYWFISKYPEKVGQA